MKYVEPLFKEKSFNCPNCGAFAHMSWGQLTTSREETPIWRARCACCNEISYWLCKTKWTSAITPPIESGAMIFPKLTTAPGAHNDIPQSIANDYEEARVISSDSPRAAAALLRLVIQKLCKELGEPGENLNDDIASLVKKGLPLQIQQALDIVRVTGNNAVHPGELDSDDVASVANSLFELVNQIIEDQLSRPKAIQRMYDMLPSGAKESIDRRDSK